MNGGIWTRSSRRRSRSRRECGRFSRKLSTPDFPGLGAVDVIVAQPRALIELKWSYEMPGTIFESVQPEKNSLALGA